jgi:hypothetical protein
MRELEGPVLRRSYLLPDGPRARVEQIGHSLRSDGIAGHRGAIERLLLRSGGAHLGKGRQALCRLSMNNPPSVGGIRICVVVL